MFIRFYGIYNVQKDEKTMTDTNLRHDNKETPTDTQRMIADYEIVLS